LALQREPGLCQALLRLEDDLAFLEEYPTNTGTRYSARPGFF
jgi:hypothetical protein